MKDPLYRFSVATVSVARVVGAGFCLGIAVAFAAMALWLTTSFGFNWFVMGFDIFLGVVAVGSFVQACTVYAASQSPERPDERERYLQSRSLYMPANQREAHRERKP